MNGPSSRVPLLPVWLAGGGFQLRPVHEHALRVDRQVLRDVAPAFSTMWKRRIASTVARPRNRCAGPPGVVQVHRGDLAGERRLAAASRLGELSGR